MQKVLATGLSGLVGTRIAQLLTSYTFTDLSFSTGVDITNINQIESAFAKNDAPWVLHLAALADVEKCEEDKESAYKINVIGTRNVANCCRKFNKKLIHISTDFVFAGENEEYFEDSKREAVDYYGQTKLLAEDEVMRIVPKDQWIILRISHPYKILTDNEPKKSFFQRMYEILKDGKELTAVQDFYSKPTYIDDIAKVIDKLVQLDLQGIYHCVGNSLLSGAEEAELICEIFGFEKKLVKRVKLDDYFAARAKRPRNLNLNNDKIRKETEIQMCSFKDGLLDIKSLRRK